MAKIPLSGTHGALYIVIVRTLERMEIQFMPGELPISRSADLAQLKIVGRNLPKPHYTGGDTSMSLNLSFYAEEESREDVIAKCRWLEALTANDGYTAPAEVVKLVWGRLFREELWVVKSVKYTLKQFERSQGYLPTLATADVDFMQVSKTNLRTSDIRSSYILS